MLPNECGGASEHGAILRGNRAWPLFLWPLFLLGEVTEGIICAANDMQAHMHDRPEFAEVGSKMLATWNDGINCSLRFDDTPGVAPDGGVV